MTVVVTTSTRDKSRVVKFDDLPVASEWSSFIFQFCHISNPLFCLAHHPCNYSDYEYNVPNPPTAIIFDEFYKAKCLSTNTSQLLA